MFDENNADYTSRLIGDSFISLRLKRDFIIKLVCDSYQ